jgi:hypothetical protein
MALTLCKVAIRWWVGNMSADSGFNCYMYIIGDPWKGSRHTFPQCGISIEIGERREHTLHTRTGPVCANDDRIFGIANLKAGPKLNA